MKIALYALMSYEAAYVDEWLEYYKKLGVDEFYVSQLKPWIYSGAYVGFSFLHLETHEKGQWQDKLFNKFIDLHQSEYDWILFFDIDEFLVLKNGDNDLKTFLSRYEDYKGVAFNWRMFGSMEMKNEGGVLDRFICCDKSLSKVIKTALNMHNIQEDDRFNNGPHSIFKWPKKSNVVNVVGHECNEFNFLDWDECLNTAYLAHHMFKSRKEYEQKLLAFKRDVGLLRVDEYYKTQQTANAFIDVSALRFMETGKFLPENYKKIVDLPDLKIMSYGGADLHLGRLIPLLRSLKPGDDFDSSLADR